MVNAALKQTPAASADETRGFHIQVENVSHRFGLEGKSLPVLNHIELDVQPGEFVAILGPSGCGKSTLLRHAAGLEPPSEGRILADGEEILGPNPSRVVVFQDPTLYPWRTVRDNVALGLQARGVLKKELLEHLRARRTVRRSRHASMKRNGLGQIKNAVSISERPPSVASSTGQRNTLIF